jgi:cold shock CspA family protein
MRIGQIITVIADRKFGFIRTEHFRDDVFFHFSTLENLNPKWLRIGQDVEFEIDELLRLNKQKLEATIVREPSRPLAVKLDEEMIEGLRPSHHPKARRRKPGWKERKPNDSGDTTLPGDKTLGDTTLPGAAGSFKGPSDPVD